MKLMDMFPDDDTAEARLVKIRWPKGVHCPECGSDNVQTNAPKKEAAIPVPRTPVPSSVQREDRHGHARF